MSILDWIILAVGGLLTPIAFFFRRRAAKKLALPEAPTKKEKRPKTLWTLLSIAGSWLLVVSLLTLIFGKKENRGIQVEISVPRVDLLGWSVSVTLLVSWGIILILLIASLLIRFLVIPKMTDEPKGIQNLLEIAVEEVSKYTDGKVPGLSPNLGAYIFTIGVYMICCAAAELFGLRSPTADLTMTFGMALVTFFLINYYGIRRKGLGGRIKSMAYPTPVILPIKIVSDIATPVSLACRLFGNMLGGMIVMDLLYTAMGSFAIGVPSVIGLYFNVFHPIIQAFIFVTLSLTFIGEAVEDTK